MNIYGISYFVNLCALFSNLLERTPFIPSKNNEKGKERKRKKKILKSLNPSNERYLELSLLYV